MESREVTLTVPLSITVRLGDGSQWPLASSGRPPKGRKRPRTPVRTIRDTKAMTRSFWRSLCPCRH